MADHPELTMKDYLDRVCSEMRDGFERVDKRLDRFELCFATKEQVDTVTKRADDDRRSIAEDLREVDERLSERIATVEANFTRLLWGVAGGVAVILIGFLIWFVEFVIQRWAGG